MSYLKKISPCVLAFVLLGICLQLDMIVLDWMDYMHAIPFYHNKFHIIGPVLEFIGNGYYQIIAILVLLLFGHYIFKDGRALGKDLSFAFLSSGIFVQIFKHIVGRARPKLLDHELFIGPSWERLYDSFPSGHTATAFCMAYVAGQRYPKAKFILYPAAASIGFARIMTDSHFTSDVVGGMFFGLLVGKVLWDKFIISEALRMKSPEAAKGPEI